MGRPPVLPKKKKDGFYLEIRNKGAKSGTIIIRDTEEEMYRAANQYKNTKDVIILGEHRNQKPVGDKKKKLKDE
ncbi:MAG: hypothetical protein AB7K37_07200 [Cyclobacteriaceae bacterium]